jgi:hypothetical protein
VRNSSRLDVSDCLKSCPTFWYKSLKITDIHLDQIGLAETVRQALFALNNWRTASAGHIPDRFEG